MSARRLLPALLLAAAAVALAPVPGGAVELPRPGRADPRLKVVDYDPDDVVRLTGCFGYQMLVQFGEDERLENVSIGDSLGWQVTPNRKANLLFLKPVDHGAAPTNMSVVTNLHRYAFELVAAQAAGPDDPQVTFGLKFRYPAEEAARVAVAAAAAARAQAPALAPPARLNTAYKYSGAGALEPARVVDDGQATLFRWRRSVSAPAIYARNAAGEESLVNYTVRGDDVVVQQLAPEFVLRLGKAVGYVRNDGYGLQTADGQPAPVSGRVGGWVPVGGDR